MLRKTAIVTAFIMTAGLSGCVFDSRSEAQAMSSSTYDVSTSDTAFVFGGEVASVSLSPSSDGQFHAQVTYKVRGWQESVLQEILDEAEISTESRDGDFRVSFVKKGTDTPIWKAVDEEHPNCSLSVEAELFVPESFTQFSLSSDVGNINVTDIAGTFDLEADVGNVAAESTVLTGDCRFVTNVGNVRVGLSEPIADGSSLEASSDTGNVLLTLSGQEEKNASVSLKTNVGNVTLDTSGAKFTDNVERSATGGSGTVALGNGAEAQLSAQVGKINVK
ncbi:MAG: hypothetical protein IJ071_11895 [Ruminococcus sp.]|nr:hypothetical protein [Ruminococcus sp.]